MGQCDFLRSGRRTFWLMIKKGGEESFHVLIIPRTWRRNHRGTPHGLYYYNQTPERQGFKQDTRKRERTGYNAKTK